jgi:peptide/nickel transport system substrate-binding protein
MPMIPIYVNSMETEFNTSAVTGWPTAENSYANRPAVWSAWDNGIILQHLKPIAKK